MKSTRLLSLLIVLACLTLVVLHYRQTKLTPSDALEDTSLVSLGDITLRLIGPVAAVEVAEGDLEFKARIDTGAARCSLHVEDWEIADASPTMAKNVGKTIRFRLENRRGRSTWLQREIAAVDLVRTSEKEETRYLVPLKLSVDGVARKVLVSLNDRSHMDYAMLVGRNYLAGQFIVDVTSEGNDQLLVSNP